MKSTMFNYIENYIVSSKYAENRKNIEILCLVIKWKKFNKKITDWYSIKRRWKNKCFLQLFHGKNTIFKR